MPPRFVLSGSRAADCHYAPALMASMLAKYLLADKAYDANDIRALVAEVRIVAVLLPKANRREPLAFDEYLYRFRYLIENCFLDFKRWRAIATCYAKRLDTLAAAVEIRILALWIKVL